MTTTSSSKSSTPMTIKEISKLSNPYYGGYRCQIISDYNDNSNNNNDDNNNDDLEDEIAYIFLQNSRTINHLPIQHGDRILNRFLSQTPMNEQKIRKVSYPKPLTNLDNSNESCSAVFHSNLDEQDYRRRLQQQQQSKQTKQQISSIITLENVSKFDLSKKSNKPKNNDDDILFIRNENFIQEQQEPNDKKSIRSLVNIATISICSNNLIQHSNISGHRRRLQIDLDTTKFFKFTNLQ